MKKIATCLIALFIVALHSFGQDKFDYTRDYKNILLSTKDSNNSFYFDKLIKRFKADDSTLTRPEMLALLIGFTAKDVYKPYNVLETERLIYKLNDEGKFKEAYDTANSLLKTYPLSYQALKEMSYSIGNLGKKDSASYYLHLVTRIMTAMLYSGNGRTPETAMFALGPADGQHLLTGAGFRLGTMGSGKDKNGNFLDILETINKQGDKVKVFFNIQHAVLRMFDGKSVDEILKE